MRRQTLVALAGAVTLAIAGCAGDSGNETASSPAPAASPSAAPPAASPSAAPTASPKAGQKPGQSQSFSTPLTAQNPAPGLLQPTNPDDRAKQVEKRIKDSRSRTAGTATAFNTGNPFNSVPLQATRINTTLTEVVAQLPSPPRTQNSPFTAFPPPPVSLRPPTAANPRSPGSPRRPTQLPPSARRPSSAPANTPGRRPASLPSGTGPGNTAIVPPKPTTTLADSIEVTGVVQINGRIYAIVQEVPNKPSSYVRAGQRLANGLVLVKRVALNPGGEPIVVLEENGVEVSKIVGQRVTPPGQRGTTT